MPMPPQQQRPEQKQKQLSKRMAAVYIHSALVVVAAGAYFVFRPSGSTPAADGSNLSVAEECRQALGYDARTQADIDWLKQCASALTAPSPGQSGIPTTRPSNGPSSGPTAGPTAGPTTKPPTSTTSRPPAPSGSGCVANPARCGFPSASTTGPPASVALTAYKGPSTVTTAGTVIQNVTMGCIEIAASNVTIRNAVITCDNSSYAVLTSGSADSTGVTTVDHVRVVCTGHGGTAFGDNRMAISYADVSHCENGGDADNNFSITYSYMHDMFKGDSVAPAPHTDGIQVWPGAQNIVFSHNTILMWDDNAAFTSGSPNGTSAQLTIEYNLLDGGSYTVYCSSNKGSLSFNRFGALGANHTAPWQHADSCQNMSVTGNVDDSGNALPYAAL
jgi:hypothetical protein